MAIITSFPGGGGKIEELEKKIDTLENRLNTLFSTSEIHKTKFYIAGSYIGMQFAENNESYRLQFDGKSKTLTVFQYLEDKKNWESMGVIARLQQ